MKIPCVLCVIASSSAPKGIPRTSYVSQFHKFTHGSYTGHYVLWIKSVFIATLHCTAGSSVLHIELPSPAQGRVLKGVRVASSSITSRNIFLAVTTLISDKISFCVTTTKFYACVSQRIRKWYNDQLKPNDRNKILNNSTGRVVEWTGSTSSCRLQHRSSFWSSPTEKNGFLKIFEQCWHYHFSV